MGVSMIIVGNGGRAAVRRFAVLSAVLSMLIVGCEQSGASTDEKIEQTSLAVTLQPNFVVDIVAEGMGATTAMTRAPDGRVFICQQNGALRVVKNGALLAAPFLTVSTDSV